MTDITERLLWATGEIDRLRAENETQADEIERLRAALREIAEYTPQFDYAGSRNGKMDTTLPGSPHDCGRQKEANLLSNIARAALRGQG